MFAAYNSRDAKKQELFARPLVRMQVASLDRELSLLALVTPRALRHQSSRHLVLSRISRAQMQA